MEKLNCDLYELSELTESEKRDTEGGTLTARGVLAFAGWALMAAVKFSIPLLLGGVAGGAAGATVGAAVL